MRRSTPMSWVAIALILSACSHQVAIGEATASGDGTELRLGLLGCLGRYEVEVDEAPDAVTITAVDQRSPISFGGPDCMDGWTVSLAEPLGDRRLVDSSNGDVIEVVYEPWNYTEFTEAQYRTAVEAAVTCMLDADPDLDVRVAERPDGPYPSVNLPDIPDGGSFDGRFIGECIDAHVEPLRR